AERVADGCRHLNREPRDGRANFEPSEARTRAFELRSTGFETAAEPHDRGMLFRERVGVCLLCGLALQSFAFELELGFLFFAGQHDFFEQSRALLEGAQRAALLALLRLRFLQEPRAAEPFLEEL